MDVWFCVTRSNRAERHNREVMNTLSETTRRSPERYGKALPHLTKTYHGSRLIGQVASRSSLKTGFAETSSNLPKSRAGSTGRCNTGLQFTRRRFKAQSLSRALIEAQSYLVEIALRVTGQVGFLGKVLSQ